MIFSDFPFISFILRIYGVFFDCKKKKSFYDNADSGSYCESIELMKKTYGREAMRSLLFILQYGIKLWASS